MLAVLLDGHFASGHLVVLVITRPGAFPLKNDTTATDQIATEGQMDSLLSNVIL